jgi:hypothetical protein
MQNILCPESGNVTGCRRTKHADNDQHPCPSNTWSNPYHGSIWPARNWNSLPRYANSLARTSGQNAKTPPSFHQLKKKIISIYSGNLQKLFTLSSDRKWDRFPNDEMRTHFVSNPIHNLMRSISWQHLASRKLELSSSFLQLPRTKEWAKCQKPT